MTTAQNLSEAVAAEIAKVEEYQGWTNRETWTVSLWLSNDEAYQNNARVIANASAVRPYIEAMMESLVEEIMGEQSGFMADAMNAFLCRVNWSEVVASFKDEA